LLLKLSKIVTDMTYCVLLTASFLFQKGFLSLIVGTRQLELVTAPVSSNELCLAADKHITADMLVAGGTPINSVQE
jgi:hypothetical protein